MLVRESISFKRGQDPKEMLGIGLHLPYTFRKIEELLDFVIKALPDMFDGKIPDDILSKDPKGILPIEYFNKICFNLKKYNKTYIDDADGEKNDDWQISSPVFSGWVFDLREKLREMGYKR